MSSSVITLFWSESIVGILDHDGRTHWLGCQSITGHHEKKNIHTFMHTWWYSSVANPHTGMFLEGGRKQNNPEEIQENEGRT